MDAYVGKGYLHVTTIHTQRAQARARELAEDGRYVRPPNAILKPATADDNVMYKSYVQCRPGHIARTFHYLYSGNATPFVL